jgi:hypothetical protein
LLRQDESTQREYFSNTETGVVTWDMPAELAYVSESPEAARAAKRSLLPYRPPARRDPLAHARPRSTPAAAPKLPDGWQAVVDPGSGKTYYAHPETGRTSWDVPEPDAVAAPAPAAAAPASGGRASAAAEPTASGSASAPSNVAARVGAMLRLNDAQRAKWAFLFAHARKEAIAKLQVRRKRFQGLRKFAEIATKRKEETAAKKRAEEEEEALERRRDELEAARPKRSILQLLEVELPAVDASHDINAYAEEHFNLNRKGFFKAKTTVEKVRITRLAPPAPLRFPLTCVPMHPPSPLPFTLHRFFRGRTKVSAHLCSECRRETSKRRLCNASRT